jgi:hypothetical protein
MNRVAKRKPRGDLRLWKEASEHAVHFEGTDPMPAIWPLSNERPGFGQWLPPKLPAFVPVRTFQWGEVARWAGGLRKRCSGWPRLHDPICHSAAASVAYTRRASPQCRTSCASFRLSFTIPGYNPGVPRRGPWGPRYTRTPGYRVRHGTLKMPHRGSLLGGVSGAADAEAASEALKGEHDAPRRRIPEACPANIRSGASA